MLIVDTNVLSALMREPQNTDVQAWLDQQPRRSIWTTTVTVMEIRHGIELLEHGRMKVRLEQALQRLVDVVIEGRVAPLDLAAAEAAGRLMATRQRAGRPGEIRDTMIAGIVLANHAILATRNTRHFADLSVPVVNPCGG
jgi:toxin FitB